MKEFSFEDTVFFPDKGISVILALKGEVNPFPHLSHLSLLEDLQAAHTHLSSVTFLFRWFHLVEMLRYYYRSN